MGSWLQRHGGLATPCDALAAFLICCFAFGCSGDDTQRSETSNGGSSAGSSGATGADANGGSSPETSAGESGSEATGGASGDSGATGGDSGATGGGSGAAGAGPNGGTSSQAGSAEAGTDGATGGANMAPAGGDAMQQDGGEVAPAPNPKNAWTHMGYDHRNWYFNPDEKAITVENAPSLVEKWRATVMGFAAGTPLIVDGRVYVMATGGTYALDLETGATIWERTDLIGTASLAYANGFIYAHETTGPDLYKLNALDGTTVWGPTTTYAFEGCDGMSSPVVAGGKVFVGHCCGTVEVGPEAGGGEARGGVEAFDADGGEPLWTYWTADPGEDGAMVWSTVGVDLADNTVYATAGNNYTLGGTNSDAFHAIDFETGTRKWVHQVRMGDIWALLVSVPGPDGDLAVNPIVMDDMVAAGDKMAAFWGVSKTGERLWGREQLAGSRTPNNGGILNAGAFDGERLYTLVNDPMAATSSLFAFDPKTGENAWEPKVFDTLVWGGVSAANGVLFAAVNTKVVILEAATGAELKVFDTGGSIAGGSAAVAEGTVVVGSGLQYPFGGTYAINNNQVIAYGLP